jgi:transcriptional regulator with XRE-family HTH domain
MRNNMPAAPPKISTVDHERLVRLGARLRQARKEQEVTAVAAAEAAGLSRVTLHRIERGEANVAIAAWAAVAHALGLTFDLVDTNAAPKAFELPDRIRLEEYPQLKKLAWQLGGVAELTPQEALDLYERNWRHVETQSLSMKEIALINAIAMTLGKGRLLV